MQAFSTAPQSGPPPNGPERIKRARRACTACNRRKVKCDVVVTGIPCTNCKRDVSSVCETVIRRRTRHKKPPQPTGSEPSPSSVRRTTEPGSSTRGERYPSRQPSEEHTLANVPYIGDNRGARPYVYDLTHSEPSHPTAPVRHSNWTPIQFEQLKYIKAFEPLDENLSTGLLKCYISNIHYSLPILDLSAVLKSQVPYSESWLLYWSVMLAAANFAGPHLLQSAGVESRKELKKEIYRRCKSLYDFDVGTNKITLIQSVILMSFWYTDAQDHTGAWHWIGVGISLAQTLGLHRNHKGMANLTSREMCIRRRLWFSLIIRDRWLSLARGLPLRINDEDCDAIMPNIRDVLEDGDDVDPVERMRFLPGDTEALAELWILFAEASVVLGQVLRVHYGIFAEREPFAALDSFEKHAFAMDACRPGRVDKRRLQRGNLIQYYQSELYWHGVNVVLSRPYVLGSSFQNPAVANLPIVQTALARARDSSRETNSVLESIMDLEDGVHLLKPMIITALIPSMQMHLYECRGQSSTRTMVGHNRLNFCLSVLKLLRRTYWSANVTLQLFEHALRTLQTESLFHQKASAASTQDVSGGQNVEYASQFVDPTFYPPSIWNTTGLVNDTGFPEIEQLFNANFALPDNAVTWPQDWSTWGTAV